MISKNDSLIKSDNKYVDVDVDVDIDMHIFGYVYVSVFDDMVSQARIAQLVRAWV